MARAITWINSPQWHRIHHSTQPEHVNKNFSGGLPLWDMLFGTAWIPGCNEYPATGLVPGEQVGIIDSIIWPDFDICGEYVSRRQYANRNCTSPPIDRGGLWRCDQSADSELYLYRPCNRRYHRSHPVWPEYSVAMSVGIAAGMFVVLIVLFVRHIIGGCDVMLLVAMALGLSTIGFLALFYGMALSGGVLAIAYLVMRRLPRPRLAATRSVLCRVYSVERWRIFKHAPLPYGVAIACGGIWAVLEYWSVMRCHQPYVSP